MGQIKASPRGLGGPAPGISISAKGVFDCLPRFVGEVFVISGFGTVSHSELPFLPHLFPHPGTGSSRRGRLLRGDPRFSHSAYRFAGCASTRATGGWLDHLAIVCGSGDLRIAIEILRCGRTHQRESSRSRLISTVYADPRGSPRLRLARDPRCRGRGRFGWRRCAN